MHSAEGLVGRRPDLHPARVCREDRAADVVRPHKADHPPGPRRRARAFGGKTLHRSVSWSASPLDHRDRLPPVPDILPDQRAGGLIIFRNPAALAVEDRVDGDRAGRGKGAESGGLALTRVFS